MVFILFNRMSKQINSDQSIQSVANPRLQDSERLGNTEAMCPLVMEELENIENIQVFHLISGGRGLAGGQHHHRINMDKYHPGYFGKVGMRHFHLQRNKYFIKTLNLDNIPAILKNTPAAPAGLVPGYSKLLGKGVIPSTPFIVKTRLISKKAEAKIVQAGGKVELVA